MTEILLTYSYMLALDSKQRQHGQPYAPLGTLYAAAMLRKNGFSFSFYDNIFSDSPARIEEILLKEKPGIFIIYEDGFNYLSKMCLANIRESAFQMIRLAGQNKCKVIVSSSDAIDNHALYLEKGADFCILGEGENTLLELITRISKNSFITTFHDIKGIAWKDGNKIIVNETREIITNLDELPFPAWDLLDVDRYKKNWLEKNAYFSMNMVTTRGCPYRCNWCAKPIYGNHYNSRSPLNVVEEMLFLNRNYAPDLIWFTDDIFGLKPGWIEEFEQLIKLNSLNLPYFIQSRVDLLLENKMIDPLVQSGCKKIWLGVESGSQKILDAMNKGIKIDEIYKSSDKLKEVGIQQAFFLQFGFPGETKEDIRKTIRLLIDLMPEDIGVSVTYPLPGTKFYESVRDKMDVKTNWTDSDDLALLFKSNFSSGYYRILHRYIHKYFRFKQSVHYFRMFIKRRFSGNREQKRRILLMPYYLIFAIMYSFILALKNNAGK